MGCRVRWGLAAVSAALVFAALRGAGGLSEGFEQAVLAEQALIIVLLVAAAAIDLRTRTVPDELCLGVAAVHLALVALAGLRGWAEAPALLGGAVLGAFVLGGGLLAFTLAFERARGSTALGGGDVKLLFALGFALGWERGLLALLIACIVFVAGIAAYRAAVALGRFLGFSGNGSLSRSSQAFQPDAAHPFVPALAVGSFLALLC